MEKVKRYCWFDTDTHEFSNSWDQDEHELYLDDEIIRLSEERGSILLQYETDKDNPFNFNHLMRLA